MVVWVRMVYQAPYPDGACNYPTRSSMDAARALIIQEVWSTEGCALGGCALLQASRSRRQAQENHKAVADGHVEDDDLARVKAFDAVPSNLSIISPILHAYDLVSVGIFQYTASVHIEGNLTMLCYSPIMNSTKKE